MDLWEPLRRLCGIRQNPAEICVHPCKKAPARMNHRCLNMSRSGCGLLPTVNKLCGCTQITAELWRTLYGPLTSSHKLLGMLADCGHSYHMLRVSPILSNAILSEIIHLIKDYHKLPKTSISSMNNLWDYLYRKTSLKTIQFIWQTLWILATWRLSWVCSCSFGIPLVYHWPVLFKRHCCKNNVQHA